MLKVQIAIWDHQPGPSIFHMNLDDQEPVEELFKQFNQLERDTFVRSTISTGYRYQFFFRSDARDEQVYIGYTYSPQWFVVEQPGKKSKVSYPRTILRSLHESMGLPIWTNPETNTPLI
jgi:hypothetical protein